MRNMSFMLTKDQILARTKTVTRRFGWTFLTPNTRVRAIEKGQGLKKGQSVVTLAHLDIIDVRREPLRRLIDEPEYGAAEVVREGFPHLTPAEFLEMLLRANRHADRRRTIIDDLVTRIEFAYYVLVPV